MGTMMTIVWIASATCVFAFIGLLWRIAELRDKEEIEALAAHPTVDFTQK